MEACTQFHSFILLLREKGCYSPQEREPWALWESWWREFSPAGRMYNRRQSLSCLPQSNGFWKSLTQKHIWTPEGRSSVVSCKCGVLPLSKSPRGAEQVDCVFPELDLGDAWSPGGHEASSRCLSRGLAACLLLHHWPSRWKLCHLSLLREPLNLGYWIWVQCNQQIKKRNFLKRKINQNKKNLQARR